MKRNLYFLYLVIFPLISFGLLRCGESIEDPNNTVISGLSKEDPPYISPIGYSLVGGLENLTNCQEVEDFFIGRALDQLQEDYSSYMKQIEYADNPYIMTRDGGVGVPEATVMSDTAASTNESSHSVQEYTTTNTQTLGADEPDIVKNTGDTIYHLTGQTLKILRSWPTSSFGLLSSIEVEGYPQNLLLDEDSNQVLVFSQINIYDSDFIELPEIAVGEPKALLSSMPYFSSYESYLKLTVIDVSNQESPQIKHSYHIPGSYKDARKIGATIHMVTQKSPPQIPGINWSIDWSASKSEKQRALQERLAKNKELVYQQNLSFWLQEDNFQKVTSSDSSTDLAGDTCENIYAPSIPSHEGLTRITSLDVRLDELSSTLLLANTDTIYASSTSLYLLMPRWWWSTEEKNLDSTYIHKFSLTAQQSLYQASGQVEGQILNSFSVDEYQEALRIATTIRQIEEDESGDTVFSSISTVNRVSVLTQQENKLQVIGQTEDLAKGERVYSARFIGPRGYVVTFRQVDPLYTLDLSDPSNPTVKGELKIPGFSTYIHPVGEDHLLTIGRDADSVTGRSLGLKISLFDVSDMENPREVNNVIESRSYSSEAEYDHHAFTYLASQKLLAIPVFSYYDYSYSRSSKVLLYELDSSFTVRKKGEVNYRPNSSSQVYGRAQRNIFVVDSLTNTLLYTLGDTGAQIIDMNNLDRLLESTSY